VPRRRPSPRLPAHAADPRLLRTRPIELGAATSDAAESPAMNQTAPAQARHDQPVGSPPAEEKCMTREELLNQLELLLPSQFEAVVFRARVPTGYLPGAAASQTERAIAVIRYIELQNQLDQLARIVQQVVTGGGPAGLGPSVDPAASPAQPGLIDFTVERGRHVRFLGRDDVLARLDEWLLHTADTRWVFVTGGPGMGKSAILAAWLARHEAARAAVSGLFDRLASWFTRKAPPPLVPHHFIRRQIAGWDQPEVIAASLAAQIERLFPGPRDLTARPESRLLDLLGRASNKLNANQQLVVLVDGLDETRADPGENPLPRFLPHALPSGIRFLCATRATYLS
jgi:hypothetical protein